MRQLAEVNVTATGDSSVILTPRRWPDSGNASVPGILWHHGAGGGLTSNTSDQMNPALIGTNRMLLEVAKHWPVLASDFTGTGANGTGWGNTADVASMEAGRTHLQAVTGCKTGPVILGGESMGHTSCVQYANAHKANTLGIFAFIPLASVSAVFGADPLGIWPQICQAWGVTGATESTAPSSLPSGAFVENLAAGLNGVPWHAWYSNGDSVVSPAAIRAFAAAIGGTATLAGSYDHSEQSVAAAPLQQVLQAIFNMAGAWVG